MWEKIKSLGEKAKETISSTAVVVGDLNGDGKVDEEDARIAASWIRNTAESIGDEASRLGKEAMRSDLAKDAASGAAIGAVIAVPVPIIGPLAGAAIGAGFGVYKNLTKKNQPSPMGLDHTAAPKDFHTELLKLDDLKQKGILSESEFEIQKKKILNAST